MALHLVVVVVVANKSETKNKIVDGKIVNEDAGLLRKRVRSHVLIDHGYYFCC